MHTKMQWILHTVQPSRKHKKYESACLGGMCVTLQLGTIVVKKSLYSVWYLKLYMTNLHRIWYSGSNSRTHRQNIPHIFLLVITTTITEIKVAATDIQILYKYNAHKTCRFWDYDYQILSEVQECSVCTCL